MLVARRDPFHPAAQKTAHPDTDLAAEHRQAPRPSRLLGAIQTVATLLAIPLGLASAYTMYRANFSPETTCQSLRAGIVSMLDKNVDARTRHLLVRKDVEAFENRCGSVDPDATAAFKTLLQSDRDAADRPRLEPKSAEEKPKDIARRPEAKPEAHEAMAPAKSAQHEAAMSDSAWLAAVRGALTSNEVEPAKPARPEPANAPAAKTPALPAAPIAHAARRPELLPVAPPPAPSVTAPALPPPATIATAPAMPPDADHPVPPAAVPEIAQAQPHGWVSHIPFVGQILDKK